MDTFEFAVAHDLGIGVVGFQGAEQGDKGCSLGRSPGVGFMAFLVETSLVADADAVGIVMTGMHADLTLITCLEYLSILLNVIVITNAFAMETGVVTGLEHFNGETLVARNYVKTVCAEDISRVDGVSRDELLTRMIMRAYARNISTLSKKSTLIADVASSGEVSCTEPTFDDYVGALRKLFVICDLDAWCPAIRSKTAIRTGPKRAFVDPSITVATLALTPESLLTQLKTFGFIFEQMCIRDFKSYTLDFDSHISHYRDRYGLESDLVLHLGDGRYALIECKLGSKEIEDGASHLVELKRLIREYNKKENQVPLREPDLMIVVTGGKITSKQITLAGN